MDNLEGAFNFKKTLSTAKRVFPYYQGESTIFDKGNFLFQTPGTKNFIKFKGVIQHVSLQKIASPWVSPRACKRA